MKQQDRPIGITPNRQWLGYTGNVRTFHGRRIGAMNPPCIPAVYLDTVKRDLMRQSQRQAAAPAWQNHEIQEMLDILRQYWWVKEEREQIGYLKALAKFPYRTAVRACEKTFENQDRRTKPAAATLQEAARSLLRVLRPRVSENGDGIGWKEFTEGAAQAEDLARLKKIRKKGLTEDND